MSDLTLSLAENRDAFANLKERFLKLSSRVKFYGDRKAIFLEIDLINKTILEKNCTNQRKLCYSTKILELLRPMRKEYDKVTMVRLKNRCMDELKSALSGFNRDESVLIRRQSESSALTPIVNSLRSFVKVPSIHLTSLKRKTSLIEAARHKLSFIDEQIMRCVKMRQCKSINHMKPTGCPHCGVVHLGGKLNRLPFLTSTHYETRVDRLVSLEFEDKQRHQDKQLQVEVLQELEEGLVDVKAAIFMELLLHFQLWFSFHLARKKARLNEARLDVSKYRYRIRRLSDMKAAVDASTSTRVDFTYLAVRYSDVSTEFEEYVDYLQRRRETCALRVGLRLLQKLKVSVIQSRTRKITEQEAKLVQVKLMQLRSEAKAKVLEALALKKRLLKFESHNLKCKRLECYGRQFFSIQRYRTHMSLHRLKDEEELRTKLSVENISLETEQRLRRTRQEEIESLGMQRIRAIRDELLFNRIPYSS